MTTHELKCWPKYFEPIWRGEKTFEVRQGDDRQYQVGDRVILREYFPDDETWGRSLAARITYVMHGAPFLPSDIWVFSFERD